METTRYELIDGITGHVIATYTWAQRRRARAHRDRLDRRYGAARYYLRMVD